MTRLTDWVQEVSRIPRSGRVGSGRVGSGCIGSHRVASGGFEISRVGPGHPDPTRKVEPVPCRTPRTGSRHAEASGERTLHQRRKSTLRQHFDVLLHNTSAPIPIDQYPYFSPLALAHPHAYLALMSLIARTRRGNTFLPSRSSPHLHLRLHLLQLQRVVDSGGKPGAHHETVFGDAPEGRGAEVINVKHKR